METYEPLVQRSMALVRRGLNVIVIVDRLKVRSTFQAFVLQTDPRPDSAFILPKLLLFPGARVQVKGHDVSPHWIQGAFAAIVVAEDLPWNDGARPLYVLAQGRNRRYGVDAFGEALPCEC